MVVKGVTVVTALVGHTHVVDVDAVLVDVDVDAVLVVVDDVVVDVASGDTVVEEVGAQVAVMHPSLPLSTS